MKILVAYDGTLHAKRALRFGIEKVRSSGGELTVLQVFDRILFVDYEAGPRAEELARSESARQREEAMKIVSDDAGGLPVTFVAEEGNALAKIADQVSMEHPDLVLVPPRYKEIAASLHMGVSTVEAHLSNVYRKLDVRRAALGAALEAQ